MLRRRTVLKGMAATAAGGLLARPAIAQNAPLKIGCSLPLTGAGFTAVGKELTGALKVYMQQHGDTVAGRKIQLIIRDDGTSPEAAKRVALRFAARRTASWDHRKLGGAY